MKKSISIKVNDRLILLILHSYKRAPILGALNRIYFLCISEIV